MSFLRRGDINYSVLIYKDLRLMKHIKRGYSPWFTLWVQRKFLFVKWWSFLMWSGDDSALLEHIRLAKEFDEKYIGQSQQGGAT